MKRCMSLYHLFLACLTFLTLGLCWGLMIAFGNMPFPNVYRAVRLGPIYYTLGLLALFTLVLAPSLILSACRTWKWLSGNPNRFSSWVSLNAMSNLFALLSTLLIAGLAIPEPTKDS